MNINSSIGNFSNTTKRSSTEYIVIHSSATKENHDATIHDIHQWHLERGWSGVGYHGVIERDGTFSIGRPLESVGAHVAGKNYTTIGICMVGGLSEDGKSQVDNFTKSQYRTLQSVIILLKSIYKNAKVVKHKDLAKTLCNEVDIEKINDIIK